MIFNKELAITALAILKPPEKMTVSEWADKYRYLSAEASSEPGKWDTSKAEYQREMMDVINDDDYETIVIKKSSQVGATEILNNIIGYIISQEPSPILIVQPTEEMANSWSKDRFSTMIRDTYILHGKISKSKSRDSNNTIRHKTFTGGHITIAISNSPASLASRSVRWVLLDEVDRYPASAGSEGDPVGLAIKRATTFWNRKHIMVSTPTIKGLSRIDAAWEISDKRHFYVPCPYCGYEQVLIFRNIVWEKDEKGNHLPKTAVYKCEECGEYWDDQERIEAIKKGKWKKENPKSKVAGFHIWEAYSPWSTLESIVRDFLEKKDNPELLKTFFNTTLGEVWEEQGEEIEESILFRRRENYPAPVPMGGLVLTCAVDVQDDRLEGEVKAWGKGRECWGIEYFKIYGNPAMAQVWKDLDLLLQKEYEHESGIKLRIAATCIDSGGHFTDQVYKFVKGKEHRRIYAIKGSSVAGSPLLARASRKNKAKILLFSIGTDTAKELIFAYLKNNEPGPGYMHFNMNYDERYFEGLTSEKVVTRYKNGFPVRKWIKKSPSARNEPLDITVYNFAALEILNPQFEKIEKHFIEKIEKQKIEEPEKPKKEHVIKQIKKRREKKNWVYGWKK